MKKKYPGDDTKLAILKKHYFDYYRPSFPSDERTTEVVNMALSIKEETEAIFKAMDEFAATPQGIGWVKASERLPGLKTPVKWRQGELEMKVKAVWYMVLDTNTEYLSNCEWLDEGQPQTGCDK